MKEFKGTKGEWKARLSGTLSKVESEGINVVFGINSKKYYSEDLRNAKEESWLAFRNRTKSLRVKENTETEANAKLIAAAPELLEALLSLKKHYEQLIDCGDCGNWNPREEDVIIDANHAIKKAIG